MAIDHSMHIVYQSMNMTCWAAATAMMLAWRENASYSEAEVFDRFRSFGLDGADDAEWQQLANAVGLRILPNMSPTPAWWEQQLASGPIMVGTPTHVAIVAGITGDGTDDGSEFHMYDPDTGEEMRPYTDVVLEYELNDENGYTNNLFQF